MFGFIPAGPYVFISHGVLEAVFHPTPFLGSSGILMSPLSIAPLPSSALALGSQQAVFCDRSPQEDSLLIS